MNRLGVFLRKLRIEHSELMFDMAQRLGVTSAFLSAVENDKRSAPTAWIDTLTKMYDLNAEQQEELTEAIGESIKQVRLNIANAESGRRRCALAFARNFDNLSDEDIKGILSFVEKGRKE